jgi:hypothetical protein
MRRTLAVTSLAALLSLGAATVARPATVVTAQARGVRTLLVVPEGFRFAPRTVGRRDCIAYPRNCVNGVAGIEVAYAISGKPSARSQIGTVLTDTNCRPDSYGVSHCTNKIRLAGGRVLTVRHDHSMMNDPCLAPGERVHVRAAARS